MAVRCQYEGRLIRFGSASHVFLLHGFFVDISALRMHELQINLLLVLLSYYVGQRNQSSLKPRLWKVGGGSTVDLACYTPVCFHCASHTRTPHSWIRTACAGLGYLLFNPLIHSSTDH